MAERVRRAEVFDHRAEWQIRLMEYDPFPLEFGRICYVEHAEGYPRRTVYREVRTPQVELGITRGEEPERLYELLKRWIKKAR